MFRFFNIAIFLLLLGGCASVPMASKEVDANAKSFAAPSGKANIYVMRNYVPLGSFVKVPVLIDNKWVADLAPNTYTLQVVDPGSHTITTKSGKDGNINVVAEAGKNYFIWQYLASDGLALQPKSVMEILRESAGRSAISCCDLVQ